MIFRGTSWFEAVFVKTIKWASNTDHPVQQYQVWVNLTVDRNITLHYNSLSAWESGLSGPEIIHEIWCHGQFPNNITF